MFESTIYTVSSIFAFYKSGWLGVSSGSVCILLLPDHIRIISAFFAIENKDISIFKSNQIIEPISHHLEEIKKIHS